MQHWRDRFLHWLAQEPLLEPVVSWIYSVRAQGEYERWLKKYPEERLKVAPKKR